MDTEVEVRQRSGCRVHVHSVTAVEEAASVVLPAEGIIEQFQRLLAGAARDGRARALVFRVVP